MPKPSAYPKLDRLMIIHDLGDQSPQPRLIPFSQIPHESIHWLWPNRIPLGKLTLLVGPPGIGKGLIALDLAARVTRGDRWPAGADCQAPAGTVLLLHADDDYADVVSPRLLAAGADLDKAITLQHPTDNQPSHLRLLHDQISTLKSVLQSAAQPRLIVADPISAFVPTSAGRDYFRSQTVLRSLLDLAKTHRLAIIAVAHSSPRPSAAVSRANIAPSFLRAAASILSVVRDPKDHERRLLLTTKNNLASDQPALVFTPTLVEGHSAPRIQWDPTPLPITLEALAPARLTAAEREAQDELDYVATRLKQYLSGGPKLQFCLRLQVPGTDRHQYRAADRLGVIKAKGADAWYWMLPEHFPKWQAKQDERRAAQKRARQERKNRRRSKVRSAYRAEPAAKTTQIAKHARTTPKPPKSPQPLP